MPLNDDADIVTLKQSYRPVLVIALLLTGLDTSASLILPDAEFAFAAPTLDANESTAIVEQAVTQLGFQLKQRPRIRDDGFFRAEFERSPSVRVSLAGRVSCVRVGIYTSRDSKTPEVAKQEATEIYESLVASLLGSDPNLLLFKSSKGKSSCEEPLSAQRLVA